MEPNDAKTHSSHDAKPKRAYSKPMLVEYGNVRELTRGAGTKTLDFHATTRLA